VTTTQEQNKKNVREYWIEVLQNQRIELIPKLLAPNYTFNGQPASVKDNAEFVASLHKEFPGFTYNIYDLIAEGEQVDIRWRRVAPATATRGAGYCLGANIITGSGGKGVSNWQVNEPFALDAS
jgi:predicted SnoaL-like aldol condensation-catalyzing enzyme